jgi:hypothetical protein
MLRLETSPLPDFTLGGPGDRQSPALDPTKPFSDTRPTHSGTRPTRHPQIRHVKGRCLARIPTIYSTDFLLLRTLLSVVKDHVGAGCVFSGATVECHF